MISGEPWRLGRRPALDGLRGVAVTLVLICHVGTPGLFAAGPVGVTVFFALSGFLITSLLIEERATTGRIDLLRFYGRRARRLGPALVVSSAVFATVGLMAGARWFFVWSDLWPVLAYVGNWRIASGGDLGALGGTWSLAVEEQFYLVWPVVVILSLRRDLRTLGRIALSVACASLVVRLLLAGSAHAAYYRTDTSAVSLAAGALLAVVLHSRPVTPRRWVGAASVGIIGVACLIPGTEAAFLWAPLAATVGGVGLLVEAAVAQPGWLSVGWLRYLGSRSYGLYLWHIPPMWVLNYYTEVSWVVTAAVTVPASLVVAEMSYRWVERPFRQTAAAKAAMSAAVNVAPSNIAAP